MVARHSTDDDSGERVQAVRDILSTREVASDEFKREIRSGGLVSARAKLWGFVTGCNRYLMGDPTHYEDSMARALSGGNLAAAPDTLLDFGGEFREADHALSADMSHALRDVLFLVAYEHAEQGDAFLPCIPDLTAALLRVLNNPGRAFTTVSLLLLQSAIHGRFFPTTRRAHAADLAQFETFVEQHVPTVYAHMRALGVGVADFARTWFDRLFVGTLPYPVVLRVLDCFLSEGRAVLFRIALALLQLAQERLLAAGTVDDFLSALSKAAAVGEHNDDDAAKLLNAAFAIPLDESRINCGGPALSICPPTAETPSSALETAFEELLPGNPSALLSETQFRKLYSWLPPRLRIAEPELLFTTSRDGFSLSQLLRLCELHDPLVLVIKSADGCVFGAFVPNSLRRSSGGRFYGTGEAFLYTFAPEPAAFEWLPGRNTYFLLSDTKSLSIGGGSTGPGLWLDDELNRGISYRSETFANEPLNPNSSDFTVISLEVFTVK